MKSGLRAPNELGLYDMTGNVGEMCSDLYGRYEEGIQTNPTGPLTGDDSNVVRGGSWRSPASSVSARGYNYVAEFGSDNIGLRLAFRENN